jgi:hypothetical protein
VHLPVYFSFPDGLQGCSRFVRRERVANTSDHRNRHAISDPNRNIYIDTDPDDRRTDFSIHD